MVSMLEIHLTSRRVTEVQIHPRYKSENTLVPQEYNTKYDSRREYADSSLYEDTILN